MLVRWVILIIFCNLWVANAFAGLDSVCNIIAACEATVSPESAVHQALAAFRIPVDSIAADFIRLVEYGQLIEQGHWHLEAAGLIVAEGGLCTSSCAAAARMAHTQPYPLDRHLGGTHFDQIAHSVKGLSTVFTRDARMGAPVEEAYAYFLRQIYTREIPGSLRLNFAKNYSADESYFNYETFKLKPGSIAMLGIDDHITPGHAIIIAGQIPELKLLLIFDPNFPWELKIHSYEQRHSPIRIEIIGIQSMRKDTSDVSEMLTFTRTPLNNYSNAVLEKLAR